MEKDIFENLEDFCNEYGMSKTAVIERSVLQYIGDCNQLINQKIYIVQFPEGNLSYCKGELTDINKFELTHNVSTLPSSSRSPIFLENTTKV